MSTAALPALDEHSVDIDAGIDGVWQALLAALDGSFSRPFATVYSRAIGSAHARASGPRPLAVGSTIPGFRVATAVPGRELALEGRHHFSTYALTFHIDELGPDRSRLRAESNAAFPGLHGRAYRLLVVSTGFHVASVRRLLTGIRHRAEHPG